MRSHVILAVLKRNLTSYFSGMLGYLFIIVFVVSGAFFAFDEEFFANNLANLDRLSDKFPLLLLFIVPAITMTVWADEKKLGTDELLFTLPASDFEILIGKYLAVLAVYTVALAFSVTHVIVLALLGQPDMGLILTTYLGYWLSGAALLAAGMFASVLTSSPTVAFALAEVICAIPVFIDQIPGVSWFLKEKLGITEPLSVAGNLEGFTDGRIELAGLFYFIGLTVFFLYLNAVMIARRHWAGGKETGNMATQYSVRVLCLVVALLCLTYSLAVAGKRLDTTSERLHTLSATTLETLDNIPDDKPVTIQAFVSKDVPQDYVPIKKELLDRLKEYDKQGGGNVEVRIVEVEPFSQEAEQATTLGIEPQQVQSEDGGRFSLEEVYLGVVLTSGFDTVVVPFFDRGTPIEYELTRSVGTVSLEKRRVVGVLTTDARVMGGFDQQSFRQIPEWQIVEELRKQYEVKEVSPDSEITAEMDVLLAILPSSLTQPQMDNLVKYVESGEPVLIFDDPIPRFNPPGLSGAPLEAKPGPGGGGMFGMQRQPGPPKADGGRATSLTDVLGIRWDVAMSLFDLVNPHPKYADVFPKELVFLSGDQKDGDSCLNPDNVITSGLQELIVFYAGEIERATGAKTEFTPLLESRSGSTGLNSWDQITTSGFFGRQLMPSPNYRRDPESHTIAALLQNPDAEDGVNAIFVSDIDIIHDVMFDVWQRQMYDLNIDNVLFVLNCVDYLAGDERFIELRKRRAKHRTLQALEKQTEVFERRRNDEKNKADEEADKEVDEAKERLETMRDELREELEKGNLDAGTISQRLQSAMEAENRKLQQREKEIEREKNQRIREVRIETEQQIRQIERRFWRLAVLIPPMPAIILGLVVLLVRLLGERSTIASDRMRQ
ncbi:MAG: Gldg family protein [Planctomycetaceae bacterium]|nr:Gldg family protein [Planctomycetaceae bacterium]